MLQVNWLKVGYFVPMILEMVIYCLVCVLTRFFIVILEMVSIFYFVYFFMLNGLMNFELRLCLCISESKSTEIMCCKSVIGLNSKFLIEYFIVQPQFYSSILTYCLISISWILSADNIHLYNRSYGLPFLSTSSIVAE